MGTSDYSTPRLGILLSDATIPFVTIDFSFFKQKKPLKYILNKNSKNGF